MVRREGGEELLEQGAAWEEATDVSYTFNYVACSWSRLYKH